MATLIKSEGPETTVTPANGKKFTLEELQKLVGGYIELVNLQDQSYPIMVVNEDGHPMGLPLNRHATALYGNGHAIVGDVVLCSRKECC